MNPPAAPSIVFFGLIAGASSRRPKRPPRAVLRRVADDNGQHQQEQRFPAVERADRDQCADRQADVQQRQKRRPEAAGGVALTFPRRERDGSKDHERRHEGGIEQNRGGFDAAIHPSRRRNANRGGHRRCAGGAAGHVEAGGAGEPRVLGERKHQEEFGHREEEPAGREPHDGYGNGREDGAAQNASHCCCAITWRRARSATA